MGPGAAGRRLEGEGEGRYLAASAAWVKGCSILLNPRIVASNEAFLRMNLFKLIVLSPISVGSMNHSPQGSFAKGKPSLRKSARWEELEMGRVGGGKSWRREELEVGGDGDGG